jgi:hypothetical protein
MTGPLETCLLRDDPAAEAELVDFFEACPTSFAQQTPAWRRVIAEQGRDEPLFLGCRRAGELLGVLPAYRYEGPLGAILNSVPGAGPLGGVACRSPREAEPIYAALLCAYLELARERRCVLATAMSNPIWPDAALYERLFAPDYVLENTCLVLDLAEGLDPDGAPVAASSNLRRNLRKAGSGALRVDEEQSAASLADWYTIHTERHRELGATPLPRSLFEAALAHAVPAGKARFFFVRLTQTDELVAGGLYVCHGQVMDAFMPSLRSRFASTGANFLLAAHSMRWARERGIRYYNWQASPPEGGVARFKRQWGSRERSYAYYTRVTGDAEALRSSTPAALREHYPWHFVLPFDRVGEAAAGGGRSRRDGAWDALASEDS